MKSLKSNSRISTTRDAGARRSESGATMAEFAFMLPVLIIVLFSIIEFGIALTKAQAIEAAAREGGRLASLESTSTGEITSRVNSALTGIPMSSPPTVTVQPGVCLDRPGETVTVRVTTTHDITIPMLWSQTVDLQGEAVFRCEANL